MLGSLSTRPRLLCPRCLWEKAYSEPREEAQSHAFVNSSEEAQGMGCEVGLNGCMIARQVWVGSLVIIYMWILICPMYMGAIICEAVVVTCGAL